MNKTLTLSVVALAFVGGFLIFYQNRSTEQKSPAPETVQQTGSAQKWETKIDDQANVNVVITPLDLSPQSAEWTFDVGMNTHSVELDQDMTKVAVLVDDQGKEYKPLAWAGPTGGHHREGTLTFARITPTPKSIV
ncbi:MAG TPA: hypothetical protein PLV25_03935, partial [Opitutales bacterium]|nr:hypothetical protein [Opitutales bacterium]